MYWAKLWAWIGLYLLVLLWFVMVLVFWIVFAVIEHNWNKYIKFQPLSVFDSRFNTVTIKRCTHKSSVYCTTLHTANSFAVQFVFVCIWALFTKYSYTIFMVQTLRSRHTQWSMCVNISKQAWYLCVRLDAFNQK